MAVALLIPIRIVRPIMNFPIDLDYQPRLAYVEIHNVGSDRMLPENFEA
jgi:hypothetical protein